MLTSTITIDPRVAQAVTRWHACHARRQELAAGRTFRPCLGIAALVQDFDRFALAVGERTFLPNRAITWMGLRDLPPGLAPLSPAIHRRGATFVHTAQAVLRYGMPAIDFAACARSTKDLKRQPVPDHIAANVRPDMFALPSELRCFETAITISERMTDVAEHHRLRHHLPAASLVFPRPYFRMESFHAHAGRLTYLLDRQGIVCGNGSVFVAAWASSRLRVPAAQSQLWWDVTHLADCLDADLEAFLLPPVPLPHWTTACRQIAGETAIVVQHATAHTRRQTLSPNVARSRSRAGLKPAQAA